MKSLLVAILITTNTLASSCDPLDLWWKKSDLANGGANIDNARRISKKVYKPIVAVIDSGVDVFHKDLKG